MKAPDDQSERLLKALAHNIRTLRELRGMTRKGLAQASGVSLPHLARIENSQGNVSVIVLSKIAKALNESMERLFSRNGTGSEDLSVIIELLKRCAPEQLDKIRGQLLAEFAVDGDKSKRIALIGLRGAGKSSVGKQLASLLGYVFIELDREVEREAGITLPEIIGLYGQTGYRNLERRCLEHLLATNPQIVLATGGGIVAEPLTYEILRNSFFTVWLHAEDELYFQRVMGQRDSRIADPLLYREAMENIHRTMASRDYLYRMADLDIDTTQSSVDEVARHILPHVRMKASA